MDASFAWVAAPVFIAGVVLLSRRRKFGSWSGKGLGMMLILFSILSLLAAILTANADDIHDHGH
ncbi:hypothetical protein [Paenibacillus sp. D51F]